MSRLDMEEVSFDFRAGCAQKARSKYQESRGPMPLRLSFQVAGYTGATGPFFLGFAKVAVR